jgi:hypothetical protein
MATANTVRKLLMLIPKLPKSLGLFKSTLNNYVKCLRMKEGIQPTDLWNMDETGFRIRVGKDQFIITKRRWQHYLGVPETGNRLQLSKLFLPVVITFRHF